MNVLFSPNEFDLGDETTGANAKRMKQRRMAKRVVRETRNASPLDKCNQISSDAVDGMKEART